MVTILKPQELKKTTFLLNSSEKDNLLYLILFYRKRNLEGG
jgi:hypothetical protein